MANIVVKDFREKNQKLKRYYKGDTYDFKDEKRIAYLKEQGFLEEGEPKKAKDPEKPQEPQEPASEFPKHTGGPWYELSNGEKVQGKEEATAAEEALKKSGE